jgi:hydroxyacylglutathione hydrolase
VLIAGFPAGSWAANCYVAATGPRSECLVVDPGQDSAAGIAEIVREHSLKPVAVLLTHGHLDHMWSVTPVSGTYDATAWIHPADRHLLADPMAGISPETAAMLLGGRYEFVEPDQVAELADGQVLEVAGLEVTVDHTPGHTGGSVAFRTPYEGEVSQVMFSGDLLFAGSIGRTDFPGGSFEQIQQSLERVALALPDDTVVRPGHGPDTTIGQERLSNPFMPRQTGL